MKIYGMKLNGVKNPIGFDYKKIVFSWKIADSDAKRQILGEIEVSENSDFSSVLYQEKREKLSSVACVIEMKLKPHFRYYWRVAITDENGNRTISETAFFETGKISEPWIADWIGCKKEDSFNPLFFKNFVLKKSIKSARLYICGLGLFEAYINGKKAGNDYLSPFINDYQTCYQYMTYDVTDLLQEKNKVEIMLANGWYKGRLIGGRKEWFGDRFALITELRIEYVDGSVELIKTDDTWKYCGSDVEESEIYDGEVYNPFLWKDKVNIVKKPEILDLEKEKLCERYSLPLYPIEECKVQEILYTPAGETVLDFGQNFSGYVEVCAKLPKGTKVILEFGEVLQDGNFYRENYRTAKARYVFTADGNEHIYRPHFTYFGFRYVRVQGWKGTISAGNFIGKVLYSEMDRTGYLETGNSKINRLYLNSLWGQKSNFLDMPTDCPQRDERLGWTGDAQVFAPTASYHMDTRAFYDKYMRDLGYDQQRHGGKIPYCLPNLDPEKTSSVWGDAATFIPDMLYEYFGNKKMLESHYPIMKGWVDYIHNEDMKRGERNLYDFGQHFGDWLALDGVSEQSVWGETDNDYIASVYYYASVKKTAKAAKVLGKKIDCDFYEKLAGKIYEQLLNTYFSPAGHLTVNTQTAYLIALRFGIYRDKDIMIQDVLKRFRKDCYRIKSGFVGATCLCQTLAEYGLEKLAYNFLLNEKYPGWLYCVNLGATTIWERWNSILEDGSMSGTDMNSLNHYAYGSVVEFLYRYSAGIQALEPGFVKAKIAPKPDRRLGWLRCCYDSAAGKYVSEWKLNQDGSIDVHVEIPFAATAILVLPYLGQNEQILEAGTYDFHYKIDKEYLKKYDWDTCLGEIAEDTEAVSIMLKYIPKLNDVFKNMKEEDRAISLKELDHMMFFSVESKDLLRAYKELSKL